jgi:hypothetical protein
MPRGEREGCKGRDESFVSECQRREGNSRRAIQVQEAHKQREKRRGRRYHVLCNVAVFIHHFCYLLHLQWSPRLGKIVIGDIAFIFFSVCTGWRDHITSTESCSRSRKKKKKMESISVQVAPIRWMTDINQTGYVCQNLRTRLLYLIQRRL